MVRVGVGESLRAGRTARVVLAVLGVLGVGCAGSGAQEPPLDTHLRGLVPFGFSGAALVAEEGETVHEAGYGLADAGAGRANTAGTVFDIGSLSKQFTAAAVLLLEERGLLSVEDTIGLYLAGVPEDKRATTLHHLLTHTSGLPPYHAFSDPETGVHGDFVVMTREEAERAILARPLDFAPGEPDEWNYSNAGYTLLAAVVERVAARPFEAFLRTEIFEPAGMARTGLYFEPLWDGAPVARGYRATGDQGSPLEWTDTEELWGLVGGGGVLSTVGDLARWSRALRAGAVLSRESVERLLTPGAMVREGLHYGYGWYVDDTDPGVGRVIRHGGANDFGFASRWRWYPDRDVLLVLLVNREAPGVGVEIGVGAVEEVLESRVSGAAVEPPPETAWTPDAELERFAGRYRFEDGGELRLRARMGSLVAEPVGSLPVSLLGIPDAPPERAREVRALDRRAEEIVRGIIAGDQEPLGRAMGGGSRVDAFGRYITGWWEALVEAGGGPEGVTVVGTTPIWWSPGSEQLATIVIWEHGDASRAFRLHWEDGRLVALGGGAIREPATTLFAPTNAGGFVGYHLGIRTPVTLSFQEARTGLVTALELGSGDRTARARRVRP